MHLAEEYLKRHSIDNKLVRHVQEGTVFFKEIGRNSVKWLVVEISYEKNGTQPGKYKISTYQPVHNSWSKNRNDRGLGHQPKLLKEVSPATKLEWDQYEDWFLTHPINENWHPICNIKDVILVAWEIFVYTHDSWFVKFIDNPDLADSVDSDLDTPTRCKAYYRFAKSIFNWENWKTSDGEMEQAYNIWSHTMLKHVRNYCYWWTKLISGKKICQNQNLFE